MMQYLTYTARLCLAALFVIPTMTIAAEKTVTPPAAKTPDNPVTSDADCSGTDKDCSPLEHITVKGRYINPISYDARGSYTLDSNMIKDYHFGNGNLNDILGLLPGVQYSESSYAVDQVSNIKPSEVSLAGTEGHQSGYYIDGVNNNSRLSSGNAYADRNMIQDISGHSQETFINLHLLDQIEVYDSNIPAEYGQFSGGLVKVKTRNARQQPSWGLTYRRSSDSFTRYNHFYAPNFNGQDTVEAPVFTKEDIDVYFSTPVTDKSGILAQFQVLRSEETMLQLGKMRPQKQRNYNALVKYHHDLTEHDRLTVSLLYAPYTGNYFDLYALNSNYEITGGGYSLQTEWQHKASWVEIDSQLSWRRSENTKTAPDYWFSWRNVTGKTWGEYNNSESSAEGGYGDIEKIQQTYSVKQNYLLTPYALAGAIHTIKFGGELQHQQTSFDRLTDSIIYNGSVINPDIQCMGAHIDCAETQLFMPLTQLEELIGRPLNLNNYNDFMLYQANIMQTGQYFQTRQVAEKGKTEVSINALSLYAENQAEWRYVNLTVGLRYDYNNFFKQHNLAPRIRMAYDLFDNQQTVLVTGLNRYFEADVLQYKLNQAITPYQQHIRRVSRNQVLNWESSLINNGYRTVFTDTSTPYSDEVSLALRQQLFGGTLEGKWLKRYNRDSITRRKGFNSDGDAIQYATNDGASEYERYTLSWMARFENQHIELNISKASNTTSRKNFDGEVTYTDGNRNDVMNFSYDDSELVFLQYSRPSSSNPSEMVSTAKLVTRNDLSLEKQDFNRPYIANISWGAELGNWGVSAYARYNSSQDALYATGQMLSIKEASSICNGCSTNKREYPVYRKEQRPGFWLVSSSLRYNFAVTDSDIITLSFDVENIFNSRTYQISPAETGTEPGRRFWLGISYKH